MPRKTITIFITAFILTGIIILGVYFWLTRNKQTTEVGTTPWYQNFNPFGVGTNTQNQGNEPGTEPGVEPGTEPKTTSRFFQITDFAVAGATFLEDTRPITNIDTTPKPEQVVTIIPSDTKEGRKEIQAFLNETLSLKPQLKVDGNFGKSTTKAISDFQKLKNIPVTGKIDAETAPFFTKTSKITDLPEQSKFETVPSIRYVERANGHMYKMFLDTKNKEKISNSTIPSIYEALFNQDGNTVIYRYLSDDKNISTFIATLGAPNGEFLPENISDLSVSQDKDKYFYLKDSGNGSVGIIKSFLDTKSDIVFNSPFTEWLSQWGSNQKIFLTTKPSYFVNGAIFQLNTSNKTLTKILGGIRGLTTLVNPEGSLVLYSTSTETGPKLGIFNTNDRSIKDLNTYGLPEKCVWGTNNTDIYCAIPSVITGNQYPDYWYQGLVSFDDYFIKINTTTEDKTTIADSTIETPIDGTHMFLNKTENILFFINKKDSTLWGLNLN